MRSCPIGSPAPPVPGFIADGRCFALATALSAAATSSKSVDARVVPCCDNLPAACRRLLDRRRLRMALKPLKQHVCRALAEGEQPLDARHTRVALVRAECGARLVRRLLDPREGGRARAKQRAQIGGR